jgi:large subunit ribosomal protein L15
MKLSGLDKTNTTSKKRLGLGHGSGRGKTAGRGTKGQKARGRIPLSFEGGALSLIKRMPFVRGKGKNDSVKSEAIAVSIEKLNVLSKNSVVDAALLIKEKIVDNIYAGKRVKILSKGELTVPLTVKIPVSKTALKKIEKAGGKVEI